MARFSSVWWANSCGIARRSPFAGALEANSWEWTSWNPTQGYGSGLGAWELRSASCVATLLRAELRALVGVSVSLTVCGQGACEYGVLR